MHALDIQTGPVLTLNYFLDSTLNLKRNALRIHCKHFKTVSVGNGEEFQNRVGVFCELHVITRSIGEKTSEPSFTKIHSQK